MSQSTRRSFVQRAAMATGGVAAASLSTVRGASAQTTQSAPRSKTATLRALLESPGVTVVPEAHVCSQHDSRS